MENSAKMQLRKECSGIDIHAQITFRSIITDMVLGGLMSLSNLYVSLKTGWSIGVSITAAILAFAIFALLHKLKITKTPFGMLENNITQTVPSAAGYMTG